MSGASGWRDAVLRSAIDAFLCDVAAKSINRGVRNCIDAENNSAFAANSSIHALIRCVSGGENCIVAAKSSGGGVVWCVDGVNDCIREGDALVGRTSVRHRGPLLRFECSDAPRLIDCGSLAFAFGGCFSRVRPGLAPAGDLLSCFAKKVGKEGDPASPVGLRPTPLRCSQQAAGVANSPFGLKQRPRKAPPAAVLLGGSDGLFGITEPWLGLSSELNGWRKARRSRAFDRNDRLRKGTVPGNGPSEPLIRTATGGEVRRSCLSPQGEFCAGRPLRAAQGSRPQRGRPVKPGRLSCLLLWRSKEVSRPPGANSPANPCWVKHHRQTSAGSRRPPDANPCQPKALPVGRTSVRHPSWGMAWRVGLKSDLQVSGPARRGATMGTTP